MKEKDDVPVMHAAKTLDAVYRKKWAQQLSGTYDKEKSKKYAEAGCNKRKKKKQRKAQEDLDELIQHVGYDAAQCGREK